MGISKNYVEMGIVSLDFTDPIRFDYIVNAVSIIIVRHCCRSTFFTHIQKTCQFYADR